jgi:hypothetical protein
MPPWIEGESAIPPVARIDPKTPAETSSGIRTDRPPSRQNFAPTTPGNTGGLGRWFGAGATGQGKTPYFVSGGPL